MRGSVIKRYKNSWGVILDTYETGPNTGRPKRKRKWHSIKGTQKDAERRLAELLHQANTGTLVEPSKLTVAQWLGDWLETAIKPRKRLRTYEAYENVITNHIAPAIGHIRLQPLQPQHLQQYDASSALAERTLAQHHAALSGALKAALMHMQGQVSCNVATRVLSQPRQFAHEEDSDIREKCWTLEEVQKFLAVTSRRSPHVVQQRLGHRSLNTTSKTPQPNWLPSSTLQKVSFDDVR